MDSSRYLFMITGAPGAGKSTLAKRIKDGARGLIEPIADVCEADDFWYIVGNGKYAFDRSRLKYAHEWCQLKARRLMEAGLNLIVSNTNIRPLDRKPYFDMAKEYGYRVVFIHLENDFGSIHGVPPEIVEGMRRNYVGMTPEEALLVVEPDEMSEELSEVLERSLRG